MSTLYLYLSHAHPSLDCATIWVRPRLAQLNVEWTMVYVVASLPASR